MKGIGFRSKKSLIAFISAMVFTALLCVAVYRIADHMLQSGRAQKAFSELADAADIPVDGTSGREHILNEESFESIKRRAFYSRLIETNPDFAAWLKAEGAAVSLPVVSRSGDPEYYLRRAYDESYSMSGTPFLAEGCDAESVCVIIYAHNMQDGTMFSQLKNYDSAEYCEKYPVLSFSTSEEDRDYEIFAALRCRVLEVDEEGFRYYKQAGDINEKEYSALCCWLKDNSIFETDIEPVYPQQIVILSTCSYHGENGRFILAARRIYK